MKYPVQPVYSLIHSLCILTPSLFLRSVGDDSDPEQAVRRGTQVLRQNGGSDGGSAETKAAISGVCSSILCTRCRLFHFTSTLVWFQVFAGKHGYITPRDLLRWGARVPQSDTELAEAGFMLLGEVCACSIPLLRLS